MTRKAVSLLLAFLLLLPVVSALAANTMQQGSMYVYTPNGRSLHFRATRSTTEDNIISEIPYGSKVWVVSWDGTWARIQYNGMSGYVVKKYLQIARPAAYEEVVSASERAKAAAAEEKANAAAEKAAAAAEKAAAAEEKKQLAAVQKTLDKSVIKKVEEYDVTVIVDIVDGSTNLYKRSSLLSDVLRICPTGTRLVVTAQNKDWAKVYDGEQDLTGYVLLSDLVADEVEEELLEDE